MNEIQKEFHAETQRTQRRKHSAVSFQLSVKAALRQVLRTDEVGVCDLTLGKKPEPLITLITLIPLMKNR